MQNLNIALLWTWQNILWHSKISAHRNYAFAFANRNIMEDYRSVARACYADVCICLL